MAGHKTPRSRRVQLQPSVIGQDPANLAGTGSGSPALPNRNHSHLAPIAWPLILGEVTNNFLGSR